MVKEIWVILFFCWGLPAWGTSFLVEKSSTSSKRAQLMKEIALDVAHTCSRDCLYKISNIREMKLLESVDKNRMYIWFYIEDAKEEKDNSLFQFLCVCSNVQQVSTNFHNACPCGAQVFPNFLKAPMR